MKKNMNKKILIIKHGSFGDFILATGAIKSIKNYFSNHDLYMLTSIEYAEFIKESFLIDEYILDERRPFYCFRENMLLLKKIINTDFEYIFDLQNSKRTFFYNLIVRILSKSIISSSRPLAHYRYNIPSQGSEHVTIGLNKQLSLIGIKDFFQPNVDWLEKKKVNINIKKPYVMIIPGTSSSGLYKRWPSENYGEIAKFLHKLNFSILVVGNNNDYNSALPILNSCPEVFNFLGKSQPPVLYRLAKEANFIISNDTGPALLVSLTNTPLLWIVNDNNISLSNKPIGKKVYKISSKSVYDISIDQVKNTLINEKLI